MADDCGDAGAAAGMDEVEEEQQQQQVEAEEADEESLDETTKMACPPQMDPAVFHLDQDAAHRLSTTPLHAALVPTAAAVAAAAATAAVSKELLQVEVELRLLEALEIYHPAKLQGFHRHFVLYGLMEYLERRLNHHFSAKEILELLERFYNLEFLKPNEEDAEHLSREEEFSLPASIFSVTEEVKDNS